MGKFPYFIKHVVDFFSRRLCLLYSRKLHQIEFSMICAALNQQRQTTTRFDNEMHIQQQRTAVFAIRFGLCCDVIPTGSRSKHHVNILLSGRVILIRYTKFKSVLFDFYSISASVLFHSCNQMDFRHVRLPEHSNAHKHFISFESTHHSSSNW